MSASAISALLNSECEITRETAEGNFIFDLILEDIKKYADPKYDKNSLTNYFYSALGTLWSAVEKRGFLAGIRIGNEFFSPPDFSESTAKEQYISLTGGKIEESNSNV